MSDSNKASSSQGLIAVLALAALAVIALAVFGFSAMFHNPIVATLVAASLGLAIPYFKFLPRSACLQSCLYAAGGGIISSVLPKALGMDLMTTALGVVLATAFYSIALIHSLLQLDGKEASWRKRRTS